MADIVDSKLRSRMMASGKGRNTKPEILIRHALHHLGFRYRLHDKKLPGKPDIVFPRYRAVIQVNGCFWHAHGCAKSKLPTPRTEFWQTKIESNKLRDELNTIALLNQGWCVMVW